MNWRTGCRVMMTVFAVAIMAAVSGCTGDSWSRISVGTTSREAALRAMGEDTSQGTGGLTLEEVNSWPTVIEVTHVEVAPEGAVEWKLSYRGAVTHLVVSQVVSTEIHYEGALPEAVARALRLPDAMTDGEFISELVKFLQGRVRAASPQRWTDPQQVGQDKYRSRFIGQMNMTMAALKGQGKLKRDDFAASIEGASPGRLQLEYIGGGIYRLEVRSSTTLGPLPVL